MAIQIFNYGMVLQYEIDNIDLKEFAIKCGYADLKRDNTEIEEMYHDNYDFKKGIPKMLYDHERNIAYWDITSDTTDIIYFKYTYKGQRL